MTDEATNPAADDELLPVAEEGVADEANAQGDDQPQLDDDGNPIEGQAEDDDSEEIEYEGKTFKGPKGLKEAILRQADYTRKTQEIAETRRALETRQAEVAQQAEAQAKTLEQRVQLATVDQALQQYAQLDWGQYAETYGERAAVVAQAQWQQLRDQRTTLAGEITQAEQEHRLAGEQTTANAIKEAQDILTRELPGFGYEMAKAAYQAAEAFGFTRADFEGSFIGDDGKADTRTFKILARLAHLETENATLRTKQTKAQIAEKQAKVQPAKTVTANAGQYKAGLDDSLPADEWRRRFQAQLAKAG